jgi:signal transduction histidine kinase
MQVSKRFLALLEQQLAQFADRPDLRVLVVYLALPGANGKPSLVPIGQWPTNLALPSGDEDPALTPLGEARRWLALRDGQLLLGALRVDADRWPWPEPLTLRLEATALCLTEALRLDHEQQRLGQELARRDDQLKLLVHQLRNPLAALRTFGQLLRRRLDGDPGNRDLVDHLLAEQGQINRYVEAIDQLADTPLLLATDASNPPLLLPPSLGEASGQSLTSSLMPLLQRAVATAALQGRPWQAPDNIPAWQGDGGAVTEIVANLLENAFRYSAAGGAVGLHCQSGSPISICVWDEGPEIPAAERDHIFEKGVRGSTGQHRDGSGLGLALALDLAQRLGGDLRLICPPRAVDAALPSQGNAFRLTLPSPP